MKTYYVLVLTSCMLLNFSCAGDSERKPSGKDLMICDLGGFSVECPKRIEVKGKHGPDFSIYEFIYNDKALLHVYAGDYPSLFDGKEEVSPYKVKPDKEQKIGRFIYKFYSTTDVNGIPMKQVLIDVTPQMCPSYLHFWYFNLSPEEQQIAEAIIFSAKPDIAS
jgi:hypothetical protein